MQKKVPIRMCVGCRTSRPKKELVRVVRSPEGVISVDLRGKQSGKGAYLCRDEKCLKAAKKSRILERTFELPISDEIYLRLEQELTTENGGDLPDE